jgi:hydrogenase maturation protein HypF
LAQAHDIPVFAVQHHEAHLASVAAEYHIQEKALGLVLDGYGYGLNGDAWGGELFLLENTVFSRLGSLHPLALLGGEMAAREPWRMGVSALYEMGKINEIAKKFPHQKEISLMLDLLQTQKELNKTNKTTSCGRLFDAAAALLNIQFHSHYEGHAAMCLESLVTTPQVFSNGWHLNNNTLNFLPTLEKLSEIDDPIEGANIFHGNLIAGLVEWVYHNAMHHEIKIVLLSGGCFLNKVLSEGLIKQLNQLGIQALLPKQLPPNDGGISLGQAWIAGNICV